MSSLEGDKKFEAEPILAPSSGKTISQILVIFAALERSLKVLSSASISVEVWPLGTALRPAKVDKVSSRAEFGAL